MEEREGLPKNVFQSLWTFVPLCLGMFVPVLGGPVSLIWSIVFGLGDCLTVWVPYSVIGALLPAIIVLFAWPGLVAIFLRWISGVAWENLRAPGRWIAVGVLVFLCSPIMTPGMAEREPFSTWPMYQNMVAGLW